MTTHSGQSAQNATSQDSSPVVADEATHLEAIYKYIDDHDIGFDFNALSVLDDDRATPAMIEALKDRLGPTVAARLFCIANSVHFGKNRSGKITKFMAVVNHLGTRMTKSTAIFIALFSQASTEEMHVVLARCFAASKLSEMLAYKLGLSDSDRTTVTLGALFIEIGKLMMLLYRATSGVQLGEDFIERHYPEMNVKIVEKFRLPDELLEIVSRPSFRFVKKDSLALSAVAEMAHGVVANSFSRHGKLVVQSSMPDLEGILYTSTAGSLLAEQFQTIGLGSYLQVIPNELTDTEKGLLEKYGQQSK
jgi:hypothetical protein